LHQQENAYSEALERHFVAHLAPFVRPAHHANAGGG
jgi:hypothetical protein